MCRFKVPVIKRSIAAIAAGSHPDSFRTRKLSLFTSDAVLRYASSRETSNAAIVGNEPKYAVLKNFAGLYGIVTILR